MDAHVYIRPDELGEETTSLSGSVPGELLLELGQGDARCAGDISYRLDARVYDGRELVVDAQVAVPLKLRCERCLNVFDYSLPVHAVINREVSAEPAEVDIAEELREEILLALPAYPKCELAGQECEIHDIRRDFGLDKAPLPGVNSGAAGERSVWDALDGISTPPTP